MRATAVGVSNRAAALPIERTVPPIPRPRVSKSGMRAAEVEATAPAWLFVIGHIRIPLPVLRSVSGPFSPEKPPAPMILATADFDIDGTAAENAPKMIGQVRIDFSDQLINN